MDSLTFYKKQSIITEPGEFAFLFDCIPKDIGLIKSLVDGLILHFWDGSIYDYQIPYKKLLDIETRYVSKMLKKIWDLDKSSLTNVRHFDKRIVGSCRDYATLFCSILRHKGIPARTRVAFSTFYFKEYNHDEIVLEYWNEDKKKWCIVDPRVNEFHIRRKNLTVDFDLLDVPQDKLVVAGSAWQMVRANKACADSFCGGDHNKNKGLWYIRDRLIQDFAALNSVEMQLWDAWGLMLSDREIEANPEQLSYFDNIAQMNVEPDKNFNNIINQYVNDPNLRVPQKIISFSPIYKKKEIYLD